MDWFDERKDLNVRDAIRNQLKGQFFGKIEIWRLFGANVTLNIWQNYSNPKKRFSFLNEFINFTYLLLFRDLIKWRLRIKTLPNKQISKPVVLEAISDEKRWRGLWLPFADRFNNGDLLLVTPHENIYNKYKGNYNVYQINQFYITDWLMTRIEIVKFIFRNLSFLYFKKKIIGLSVLDLLNIYIIQLDYVIRFKYLVHIYNPVCYVTLWDWYYLGSAGSLVFKSNKLHTFTFLHGACGKEALREFLPLNADYIFSWGNLNTISLIDLGVKPEAILEVGCPRFKTVISKDLIKTDFSSLKILIILSAYVNICFFEDIIKLVDYFSSSNSLTIRLHPSTSFESIDPAFKSLNVQFVTTNDESIEETILKSDIVLIDTSSSAFDVIHLDKPLFIIDSAILPRPQDIVNEIINYNAAIFCRSYGDFIFALEEYCSNEILRKNLALGRKKFIKDFIAYKGCDSADEMIRSIINIIK